ncbi:hypothetical protein JEQ12_009147 [Ovis aries]|uniref:Protein arginine N-methyltransferase 4 n=1 Tax=Ovis aries TaxID=9940 RepID=A0A836AMV5_SHEEP|nr:hypothetical protein JEQ12_009147 [Ovis aries]
MITEFLSMIQSNMERILLIWISIAPPIRTLICLTHPVCNLNQSIHFQFFFTLITPASKSRKSNLSNGTSTLPADSLCVFRCSLSRDTECCYVGKESILITLGYYSALLKFASHAEFSAFSNALRRYQCEKKEHLVFSFSQRTEEVSAAQYFEFYDCLSQQQNVMRDFVMTATYHRAILQNHTDFRNKVVLDVGCGSGILSFFAVQAGALRVYAVEAGSVAQYAELGFTQVKLLPEDSKRQVHMNGRDKKCHLSLIAYFSLVISHRHQKPESPNSIQRINTFYFCANKVKRYFGKLGEYRFATGSLA